MNPVPYALPYARAPLDLASLQAQVKMDAYLLNPTSWLAEVMGEFAWSKQREIFESIRDNKLTACISCHNSGKSWTASRATAQWITCHPPGEAFVVTSATTGRQVKAVLWREMNRAHAKGKLAGRMNQTEWYIIRPDGNEELVAFGQKPGDHDTASFHGIHARFVLVIFDEAGGMEGLWEQASSLVSNQDSKFLAIGQCDDPVSHFAEILKPKSGWNVISISAFDTPNFTGEWVPQAISDSLISVDWAEQKRLQWGEENPFYISKVLGKVPDISTDGLIPLKWIRDAQERDLTDTEEYRNGRRELGVDVGGGGDKNVVYGRRGPVYRKIREDHEPNTSRSLGRLIMDIREYDAECVKVDKTGIGWGMVCEAETMFEDGEMYFEHCQTGKPAPNQHYNPIEGIMVGSAPQDKEKFLNLRAEIYWGVREMFEAGEVDIDPDDEDLAAELMGIKWKPNSAGKIQVSPKRKPGGLRGVGDEKNELKPIPSPDNADGFTLCSMKKDRRRKSGTGRRSWVI